MRYWLLIFWVITAVASILLALLIIKESKKKHD